VDTLTDNILETLLLERAHWIRWARLELGRREGHIEAGLPQSDLLANTLDDLRQTLTGAEALFATQVEALYPGRDPQQVLVELSESPASIRESGTPKYIRRST
jgi:hypothetical protein